MVICFRTFLWQPLSVSCGTPRSPHEQAGYCGRTFTTTTTSPHLLHPSVPQLQREREGRVVLIQRLCFAVSGSEKASGPWYVSKHFLKEAPPSK